MKNTLKGSMKKVMGTKIGKVAVGGTMAFMIFGGGIASASYILKDLHTGNTTGVLAQIQTLGGLLESEVDKKWAQTDLANTYKAEKATLTTQITAKNAEIATLTAQVASGSPEIQAKITSLESQVATLTAQKASLTTQQTQTLSDIDKLNLEVDKANAHVLETKRQMDYIITDYNNGARN